MDEHFNTFILKVYYDSNYKYCPILLPEAGVVGLLENIPHDFEVVMPK